MCVFFLLPVPQSGENRKPWRILECNSRVNLIE